MSGKRSRSSRRMASGAMAPRAASDRLTGTRQGGCALSKRAHLDAPCYVVKLPPVACTVGHRQQANPGKIGPCQALIVASCTGQGG